LAVARIERGMDGGSTAMQQPVQIALEPARPLAADSEVALLRAAHAKNPAALPLRTKLADLLISLDRYDEAIVLLADPAAQGEFALVLALARALLARKQSDDNDRALAATERALHLARDDRERARALAEQGKALSRQGHDEEALVAFDRAFALDRRSVSVFKRWSVQQLRLGMFARVETATAELIASGIAHSRVLAARTLALAGLGESAAARALSGIARFVGDDLLAVSPGWPDLAAFNAQVAAELLANPGLRYQRFGTASLHTWRVDSPASGNTPAVKALLGAIATHAARWIAALPAADHPWLSARPDRFELRSWAVITEGEGREQWHMHPFGWLSGGYYVAVPEAVAQGSDAAGCLAFGLPGGHIGTEAAAQFGETRVRPQAGTLSLFPSHAYHSTYPHKAAGKRICLAFDLCPA
jgi:tetratricopeptide (TPR) repeat protein